MNEGGVFDGDLLSASADRSDCDWQSNLLPYLGSEHLGGDFATVVAVADVGVDEVFAFNGLHDVS